MLEQHQWLRLVKRPIKKCEVPELHGPQVVDIQNSVSTQLSKTQCTCSTCGKEMIYKVKSILDLFIFLSTAYLVNVFFYKSSNSISSKAVNILYAFSIQIVFSGYINISIILLHSMVFALIYIDHNKWTIEINV